MILLYIYNDQPINNVYRLMNLEILSEKGSTVWLENNELLDSYNKSLDMKTELIKRKIDEIHSNRKNEQLNIKDEINKYKYRRDKSINNCIQLKNTIYDLKNQLISNNVSIE